MTERPPHIARLEGEIDLANAAQIGAEIQGNLAGAGALVVDLAAVTYFDSTGLRMLDELVGACDAAGIPFRVVAPDGGAARFILRIAAWREALLAETAEEALAAVS